jgi:hypothetical protein
VEFVLLYFESPSYTSRFTIIVSQKTCIKESTTGKEEAKHYTELEIKQHDPHLKPVMNSVTASIHRQMLVVFVFFIFSNYLFSRSLLCVVRSATISAEKRDGRSVFTSG